MRHLAGCLKGVVSELTVVVVWERLARSACVSGGGGVGGGVAGTAGAAAKFELRHEDEKLRAATDFAAFRFHEDDCSAEASGIDGMGSFFLVPRPEQPFLLSGESEREVLARLNKNAEAQNEAEFEGEGST